MILKDPKTGKFYDVDMRSPEQKAEAARMGLKYASLHYFHPDEIGGDDPNCNYEDVRSFYKQVSGVDTGPLKEEEK